MKHCHGNEDHYEEMRSHLKQHLIQFAGNEDTQGLELSSLIRIVANYYSAAIHNRTESNELSGPRMGILIRLMVAEESGNSQGINPTELSHFQNVKKNTISSLLRGLEERGLIERTLDPVDKRAFKIRITKAGKELIKVMGPSRLRMMNDLSSSLTIEEIGQLIALLDKLRKSMKENVDISSRSVPVGTDDE